MDDERRDKIILSFQDSLLHESDLLFLNEGQWLNDNLIGFMFEYFEHEEFKEASEDIAFVNPDVTQYIKLSDCTEVGIFLEPLNLPKHKLLFFAINDNESKTSVGGSHWSLLVYKRETNSFTHYDSFHGSNIEAAKSLVKNIQPFVNDNGTVPSFVCAKCPQQQNSCDCGVYVISITEYLCKDFLGLASDSLSTAVNASAVSEKRRHIKKLILRLGSSR